MRTERIILSSLVHNETFTRKTIPYLKAEYFHDEPERVLFDIIEGFVNKYNAIPSLDVLGVEVANASLNTTVFEETANILSELERLNLDDKWLIDTTEKFCQDKALYNAIKKSIKIIDEKDATLSKGDLPRILSEALSVSFDNNIGHDFIEDFEKRFKFYHEVEEKIPFHLSYFNKVTKGGISRKTLTVVLAGIGVGKSLFMCDMAASHLVMGKNVLYITLEMSEEKIAERIDSNVLDLTTDELYGLEYSQYKRRIDNLNSKTTGKLIVKEYPTASAGSANFRHLINELRIKKNFVPDVIYVDYINICASSRMKYGANVSSYHYIKSVAEELRGLAVEFDVPVVTATQLTRTGYDSSDPSMTDTAESWGLPATADFMFVLIDTGDLKETDRYLVKQLKNRYNNALADEKFMIGVDKSKMRCYDLEVEGTAEKVDLSVFKTQNKFDKTKLGEVT